jgi:hypothetical protein
MDFITILIFIPIVLYTVFILVRIIRARIRSFKGKGCSKSCGSCSCDCKK